MREVTVQTVISAPRDEVFDFVSDLAARPAWTDHYLHDYRLARINTVGEGAAESWLRLPLARAQYAELSVTEFDRPRRIVEQLAVGRRGRNRSLAMSRLHPRAPGITRVELTYQRAGHVRRPDQGDRGRRLHAPADQEAARAAAHDLRGAAEGRSAEGLHRRLRGGKGRRGSVCRRNGPGAFIASLDCRAACPRSVPDAARVPDGARRGPRRLETRSPVWTSRPARGNAAARQRGIQRVHHAPAQPGHSGR